MNYSELFNLIKAKKSFLCVGLDTDINKIPKHLLTATDPCFEFNKAIIDSTNDLAAAYKINIAFYENQGAKGWLSLQKTIDYINSLAVKTFTIADAKRADIGNTSEQYAKAFFDNMNFDAITVSPYMGSDSVSPFLSFPNKWTIILVLTSNKGANDFQQLITQTGNKLYEDVLIKTFEWGNDNNTMYVIGANNAKTLEDLRKHAPNHFLLIPGVGAQGGSLAEVVKYGMNSHCGLLVNSSRNIIYADNSENFAAKARIEALNIQTEMNKYLVEHKIV